MRVVRAVLLGTCLTLLCQPIPAQNSSQPDQLTTIRATAGEVLLDMVVRDKHHKLVTDLRAEDVEVYEDGVRQDVKHFRLVEGGEDAVRVLESNWFDRGDRNIGSVSSKRKCRTRDQVRHRLTPERPSYIRPFEG